MVLLQTVIELFVGWSKTSAYLESGGHPFWKGGTSFEFINSYFVLFEIFGFAPCNFLGLCSPFWCFMVF